jgi:hypothetical protein
VDGVVIQYANGFVGYQNETDQQIYEAKENKRIMDKACGPHGCFSQRLNKEEQKKKGP